MKKIKAITASLIMLVGILTLAFGSQDVEAQIIGVTVPEIDASFGKKSLVHHHGEILKRIG